VQELKLRAKGLFTHPSDLAAVPEGALSEATNVVIDEEDTVSPRRGYNRSNGAFSDASYRANVLTFYQDYLFAHYSTNLLAYYSTILDTTSSNFRSSGSWTTISGTYSQPDSDTKIRFAQASKNLYFTSLAGVYKLDAYNSTPRLSGAYKGLDVTASTSASASTWMATAKSVAYRVVWGYKDANTNLITGSPSQREIYTNSSGSTKAVTVRATIPDGVTTSWFFQVYRSSTVDSSATPSDELGLVYEGNPSSTDISNGYVQIDDITPAELRGATIYTAASQEGLAAGNEQPPQAKDIAVYKNSMFYANTTSRHRYYVTLLSVGGSSGIASGDRISIGGVVYSGAASETVANGEFAVVTGGSASQNIRDTALSLVRVINQYSSSTVSAYYVSGVDDLPGKILIEAQSLGTNAFYIGSTKTSCWSPTPGAAATFSSVNTSTEVITTSASHNLSDGDAVVVAKTPGGALPSGLTAGTVYYVRDKTSTTLKLAATSGGSAIDIGSGYSATVLIHKTTEASTNDRYKHGMYFSKTSQPESVPLTNFFLVGSADDEIQRIVPLRDSLLIFKKRDGIYRLSGQDSSSFQVDLLDSTTRLLAPDTVAVLNNQVFCLTDQGVVSVTEAGVQVRSRAIETSLTSLLGINASVLKTKSFGVAYETERKYILYVPSAAVDTSPTQAYVFNTFTDTWTNWDLAKTCGLVNPANDKLYLGSGTSAYVNEERKELNYRDYADYGSTVTVSAVSSATVTLSDVSGVEEGDVIFESSSKFGVVTSVDAVNSTATVSSAIAFTVSGSVDILKAIPTTITWVPLTASNPGMLKHYREVSALFKSDFLGSAELLFASDVSRTQEAEDLEGTDLGLFGLFQWGDVPWGGGAVRRPFRVYVPRNKQRCSQLTISFEHSTAFAKYKLNGMSIIANAGSERVSV
jgi:hypothetical protein